MDKINKAAAAGVIFFSVILAGFVGVKIDQTTVALLGGAFIGLIVAIPTTALIMIVGMRKRDDTPRNVHYHDQRREMPMPPPSYYPQVSPPPQQWDGQVVNPHQQRMIAPPVKRQHYVIGSNDDNGVQEGW
jgi:hypothetical protein